MVYLYGSKPGTDLKLVATFDSEPQLRAYVRWATLRTNKDGTRAFEQASVLIGYSNFRHSKEPLTNDDPSAVIHNPTPSML